MEKYNKKKEQHKKKENHIVFSEPSASLHEFFYDLIVQLGKRASESEGSPRAPTPPRLQIQTQVSVPPDPTLLTPALGLSLITATNISLPLEDRDRALIFCVISFHLARES